MHIDMKEKWFDDLHKLQNNFDKEISSGKGFITYENGETYEGPFKNG
jgi:hypothetical protein